MMDTPRDSSSSSEPVPVPVPGPVGWDESAPRPVPPRVIVRSQRAEPSAGGGFFWLFATASLVLAAWFVGPVIVERYQYAATNGRIHAEYEHASAVLRDQPLQDVSQAFQLVAQKIRPSVVSVTSVGVRSGQGSGVILSEDGYIVTNAHVIQGAQAILVSLHNRQQFTAQIVGTDQLNDLAVLRIDASDLIPAEWGDSESLRVGSMVWAVGSPYGLDQTITSGILSAKNRVQENNTAQELIQTDAAINPGNSGGPLVNAEGQVVGINTSIFGDQFQGISFAVPSSVARYVCDQLRAHGRVTRGFLGVRPRPVVHRDMQRLHVPDLDGAVVNEVTPGTPADRSGLAVDDVIRCWNGSTVRAFTNLYRYIAMTPPGTDAQVDIIRDGQPMTLSVHVSKRPPD